MTCSAATRIRAELTDPPTPASIGEALFWLVALARGGGIDPEGALRAALVRFKYSYEGDPPIR